jgi:lambda family phage portal protein
LHIFHPIAEGQIRGVPWVAPAMVRLWLLDQYDDAELDRKKVAAMFAGFVTRPGPDDVMGEDSAQKDADGAALVGLQPGTMQLLLPGEDIKFSDPADVGGSYESFQYRTLLACCAAMGMPYTNVTGDLRQANYSSLREGKLEFRRRIEQFQHNTLIYQLCRPVWNRWLGDAALSGALELPGLAENPASYLAVKWIPPKWDWVDPLKDRKAEIEAIEAGLKSRSDVIESEGYDSEEVDRRIAADRAREAELGLSFGRTSQGQKPADEPERELEERDPEEAPATITEENAA